MYVGASLVLIAVGAIMRFAVSDSLIDGVSLDMAGWIVMAIGFLGLIVSLIQMLFWRGDRVHVDRY